jgi:hypothetical protein
LELGFDLPLEHAPMPVGQKKQEVKAAEVRMLRGFSSLGKGTLAK